MNVLLPSSCASCREKCLQLEIVPENLFTISFENRVSTLVKSQFPGAPTAVACFSDALLCVAKMCHGRIMQQNTWRLEGEEIVLISRQSLGL